MTNEEIEPLVPIMPRRSSKNPESVRTDGGRQDRYVNSEQGAPFVPWC
ncbi:MAG: hypothetical protein ACLFNI_03435 [Natronomonas sp.]